MLRGGEACVSYVFGIALHCGLDDFSQIGVAFKEFWRELLAQPEHIVRDENLSVALGRCADADGRYGMVCVIWSATCWYVASMTQAKAPAWATAWASWMIFCASMGSALECGSRR